MVPSRYLQGKPLQIKKRVSDIKHLTAPLKGLSLSSQLVTGDPLSAPILDNWVVRENMISVRPGTKKISTLPAGTPISAILPYYGGPDTYALASIDKIYSADLTLIGSGYGSDDWAWTAFSNLGDTDYTILVNGHDGVWSWNGGKVLPSAPIVITSLSNANPCVATVAAADIAKFHNGDTVTIVGATGLMSPANGSHIISLVGTPANTFTLPGVDTSAATAPQTANLDAIIAGSLFKENVTAPPTATWIDPLKFDKTLTHMNRLWFADSEHLAIYYLPLQQKTGVVKHVPLNAIFRRGGHIQALYTWTVDGGVGMDDQIVIFTSNGEAAIYGGVDPDSDFQLVGIFRFDAPMAKQSIINFGGDLYVMISTGLVAMSTMLRAETEQLGKYDKNIVSAFREPARAYRNEFGWGVMLDPHSGFAICNVPLGGKRYKQLVRFMPDPIWASWSGLEARCWGWVDSHRYYGTDAGELYEVSMEFLSDNGNPITADVQFAWYAFGTQGLKHFKMALPYMITDGTPRPYVDVMVDYNQSAPLNLPEVTQSQLAATWDVATWDQDYWSQQPNQRGQWQGIGKLGRVGAVRIKVSVKDCTFSIAACDVIFETGAAVG